MSRIRVLLVDDQEIILLGIKLLLEEQPDIVVSGSAGSGQQAIIMAEELQPDVVLLDVRMPGINGVEATLEIKRKCPQTAVVILTTFNEDEYIFEALKNGASGYLLKESLPEEIIQAIRAAHAGGAPIQPSVAAKVVEKLSQLSSKISDAPSSGSSVVPDNLSERELSIACLVGQGMSNRQIARALFLSEGTVRNYLSNLLSKLGLNDRTQLALYVVKNKLQPLE
ncbi:MAG: response regulator [Acidobacteriota bacterium]